MTTLVSAVGGVVEPRNAVKAFEIDESHLATAVDSKFICAVRAHWTLNIRVGFQGLGTDRNHSTIPVQPFWAVTNGKCIIDGIR